MRALWFSLGTMLLLAAASPPSLDDSLHAAAVAYRAHIARIAPVAGRDTTFDYYIRLVDDEHALNDPSVPDGYTADAWHETVRQTAQLDLSLAQQLIDKSYRSMATIRGLGEALVRSSLDGTMQPVAVYVPASYAPNHPAPLVVLLHGRPQSETQLLSPAYIGALAEVSGSIVIAPWGRGYYNFRGASPDVYDALDAAKASFAIDARRVYLAGYSMGGFSVFEIAPERHDDWAAVMCIAGSLLGADAQRLVGAMRTTPFYVLTGSDDDSIPTLYPTTTAAYLQSQGLDVSFYSQHGGIHRLITLLPILTQAWSDMLHHIVRAPAPMTGAITLPSKIPTTALKP